MLGLKNAEDAAVYVCTFNDITDVRYIYRCTTKNTDNYQKPC